MTQENYRLEGQRAWEEEQVYLDSENAKAIADAEAQVKKEIARYLTEQFVWHDADTMPEDECYAEADYILSRSVGGKTIRELIEGWVSGKLLELDPDQSLPPEPDSYYGYQDVSHAYRASQKNMLKEGWHKTLDK